MSDLPPGRWTPLLIGNHWPDVSSLNTLVASSSNRTMAVELWSDYADLMRSARIGPLAGQDGQAAERIQELFIQGEDSGRRIAQKNATIRMAYESARGAIAELRAALSSIADRGNEQIRQIETSKALDSTKVALISDVVADAQMRANVQAACQSDNIVDAIQLICTTSDTDASPRDLARRNGVNLDQLFMTPAKDAVHEQVATKISLQDSDARAGENRVGVDATALTQSTSNLTKGELSESAFPNGPQPSQFATATTTASVTSAGEMSAGQSHRGMSAVQPSHMSTTSRLAATGELQPNELAPVPVPARSIQSSSLSGTEPECSIPFSQGSSATSALSGTSAPFALSESPPTPHTPTDLAHSLNTGPQAGAPVSIGAEASSANAVQAAHQTPTHSPVMPTPPMPPAVPLTTGTEAAVAHAAVEPTASPTVIAAPQAPAPTAVPVPPPVAVSTPTPPTSALPAYGADLRVPAATVPAASPTPAAPASAHLTSSPTSTLGQPSVVRHQSAPQAATTATALTERAVAATATGSIAGAAVGHSIAVQRLRQLLTSVARQAPELGWAIGDRNDHTTVLATDLASGWIPPNIHIPSGVVLLDTGMRSGSLTNMLGETTHIATHAPGQHLPPADLAAPPTSTRPRKLAPVDELNWELAQATKWRDGLPRLAHTLARAIASGTGYLESEVHLLRDALDSTGRQALDTYPNTDPNLIGNWQLLATIDALINGETMCANYHLAWFGALSPTGSSKR